MTPPPTFFGRLAALAALALLCLACEALPESQGEGEAGEGGAAGLSLRFVPEETLQLEPGETEALSVEVTPPGFHSVEFALIAEDADAAFDGFLADVRVVTGGAGDARTSLTAPSQPALFVVRASTRGGATAERVVSVSSQGFVSVVAEPRYSGERDVPEWTASARVGRTCSEVSDPWTDGALTVSSDTAPLLEDVPVGPPVAIVVRAGRYASGCATAVALQAGERARLVVDVVDRPIQLDEGALTLTLDVEERTEAFVGLLGDAAAEGAAAYAGSAPTDAELLLADLEAATPTSDARDDFAARAATHDFQGVLETHLGGPSAARDELEAVLLEAAARVEGPAVFVGRLELGEGEPPASEPVFYLASAAGVPAALSGFLGATPWTSVPEPEDVLVLGGSLSFSPVRWLTSLAEHAPEDSAQLAPAARLAAALDCTALGASLAAAAGGESYDGCDADCSVALCEAAFARGWARAAAAGTQLASLRVALTGAAEVDDEARPVALSGSWRADLPAPEGQVPALAGEASGERPPAE
jgi:hypothetical protein